MAPRTGPRGVTNEDVARRAGVSYVYAPTPNQPPPIDASTLANFLIGGQAPGYGMKYGGFPTAGYGQAAITGQAYAIADLARQAQELAAARQAELKYESGKDIAQSRSAIASKYRYNYQPSAEIQQAGQALRETQMRDFMPTLSTVVTPLTEEEFQGRLLAKKLAEMSARAKLKSALEDQQGSRQAELTALETPIQRQYESDVAQQVAPARSIGEALGSFTPSQLAQQIAVSRYGYDPMLASGLFGAQTDLGYASQQQAIQDAQLRAMGYNTGLSTDEILAQQLSPEEFQQYQINKALGSYENTMTDDSLLEQAYGVSPSSISSVNPDLTREAMADNQFLESVTTYRNALSTNDEGYASAEEAANSMARDYLEKTKDPIRAQILLDILRQYSFTFEG